jgi:tetratricopeptide (TPR) repeat protein
MLGVVNTWLDMERTGQITQPEFQQRVVPMLDRVEAVDPGNAWLLSFRGQLAQQRGEHELAERLAKRAVASAPGVARLHNILSDIYTQQENLPAAIPEMDITLALNPLDANVIRYRASKLRWAGRLDEARTAVQRAIELDPNNSSNYWELGANEYLRGNLVEAAIYNARAGQLDRADPESSADLAGVLAEIGESDAADAWIAESFRQAPGNLLGASASVLAHFDRGDRAVAWERAMKLISRRAEEHHDYWRRAMIVSCLAADELGRMVDTRTSLVATGALPRDLTTAGFDAWVGPTASAKVRLRELVALRRCVYTQTEAEAPRREQLRAIVARVEGADWESGAEWHSLADELRNDREAMITERLPPNDAAVSNLAVREAGARMLGIADGPRIVRHYADQREQIAQMRSALPAALAGEKLSMLPAAGP